MRYLTPSVLAVGLALAGCSSGGDGGAAPAEDGEQPPVSVGSRPPDSPVERASALFVLGDSLSDIGNAAGIADYLLDRPVYPATVGLCNPADVLVLPRPCDDLFYRQSRVSDGPVAVEYLAAHLGITDLVPSLHLVPGRPVAGTAYAIASAKARGQQEEDLERQVDMLLLDHAPLPADALYVVMIGGNDAIDALQAEVAGEVALETSAEIVASAVAAIGANVERLLDFGARRLVVANAPDLATLPAVRIDAGASENEEAVLAAASAISETLDRELGAVLAEIERSEQWLSPTPPVLTRFDLRAALHAAQRASAASGGNMLDACFDSAIYRQTPSAERVFHPDCAPTGGSTAPRFAGFVFWDGIHPTGAAHAAIGAALIEIL